MDNNSLKISPQLRIAVTPRCNLGCYYCRPEGEGWPHNVDDLLDRADLQFLLKVSAAVGFTHVKFTGGEPLLREDIIEIVADAVRSPGILDVQMVTNGTLLEDRVRALRDAGLSLLTVSLDTGDPHRFQEMCKSNLAPILNGLAKCKRIALPVRINMVLTRRNFQDLGPMMELARRYNATLKVLDVVNLAAPAGDEDWLREFVPFSEVTQYVEARGGTYVGEEPTPGGVGAALLEYRMTDGLQIVLKDAMHGTWYHGTCESCEKYPCQDAMISLRVTHDGYLKKCLTRNDNLVRIRDQLVSRNWEESFARLNELFQLYVSSRFVPNAWRPPNPQSARVNYR